MTCDVTVLLKTKQYQPRKIQIIFFSIGKSFRNHVGWYNILETYVSHNGKFLIKLIVKMIDQFC